MNKKIKLGLLVVIGIILVISGFNIVKNDMSAIEINGRKASTTSTVTGSKLVEGEIDPTTYNYKIHTGTWEGIKGDKDAGIPQLDGYQIYCIQPGTPLRFNYTITYEEALALAGKTYGPAQHKCAATPRVGNITRPIFRPETDANGNDIKYELPTAVAYIVSNEPIGKWDINKQRAMWNLRNITVNVGGKNVPAMEDGFIMGDTIGAGSGPSTYDAETVDYAKYDKEVRSREQKIVDKTNLDDIQVNVNQDKKEYSLGPLNVDYALGRSGTLAFSGISEMKLVGYNKYDEIVNEDIKIERILLKDKTTGIYGDGVQPKYFNPGGTLKVDTNEQVYPEPGQDFQIVFHDPNEGLAENSENRITGVTVKIKYKYMLANGEYTKLRGTKYTVRYQHDHEEHCDHNHRTEGCIVDCYWDGYDRYNPGHDCGSYYCKLKRVCKHYCRCGYDCEHSCYWDGCEFDCDHDCEEEGCGAVCKHNCFRDGCEYDCDHDCEYDGCPSACEHVCHLDGCVRIDCDINHDHYKNRCTVVTCSHKCNNDCCYNCETTGYLEETPQQWLIAADAIRSLYEEEIELKANMNPFDITMDLGGHVWEDIKSGKEELADGICSTQGDIPLKNVKVTLYEYDKTTGKSVVATLLSDPEEKGISDEILMRRVNPTYTDSEGNYLFEGLNPMKKYYVQFEYNGQTYLPTEYLNTANKQYESVASMVNAGLYNTNEWNVASKGAELSSDRDSFNKRFEEIKEYPNNYKSTNALGVGQYNSTFSQKDLMGYVLDGNGKYKQTGTQLVDGFEYDENGIETTRFKEGVISELVRNFIIKNKKFPSDGEMKQIYKQIAGNNNELLRKLQFIWDCKINSYTASPFNNKTLEVYPVYNQFSINHSLEKSNDQSIKQIQNAKYNLKPTVLEGVTYNVINPGQLFINLGLWRRQETDLAIRKDVYRAVVNINNKTALYKYDKRDENDAYWDINVRMSDYQNYYGTEYNREIYNDDYLYKTNGSTTLNHPGNPLEVYVTYKITVRNQSMSIMNQVTEVVDYYDKDYTYLNDLSWVMYKDGNSNKVTFKDEVYHEAVNTNDLSKIDGARKITNYSDSQNGITNEYNALYIRDLAGKKLATGESAYIYLTFRVDKDSNNKILLDNANTAKENIVEINGYKTFYKDGTALPNNVTKTSNDIAGLIDIDSTPGNLTANDITGTKYEKNFEDDTDRAKGLRVMVYEAKRKISGTVWDDDRSLADEDKIIKAGQAVIADGIRDNDETKVAGVTVQLVEKTTNGKEYIWYETTTDANGYYEFEDYIPGEYIVRFYYGNKDSSTKIVNNDGGYSKDSSVKNKEISYNGQDYKSTLYQVGLSNDNLDQTETGTYRYDIYTADKGPQNISDAKDIWEGKGLLERIYKSDLDLNTIETRGVQGRITVNQYSSVDMTNRISEVLASPYETPTYNGRKYDKNKMESLIDELQEKTYMTAETGVMTIEFEYDRTISDGLNDVANNPQGKDYGANAYNGTYHIKNVDFGLTERPKAQLELDKYVTGVKVTLANGSILFDVNKAADNVIWQPHTIYNMAGKYKNANGIYPISGDIRMTRSYVNKLIQEHDNGIIQLTMDEELMHGATIEISYKMKITNAGEYDYNSKEFYYKGTPTGNVVTTNAKQLIDYVPNNLKFDTTKGANNKWQMATADELKNGDLVNANLYNTISKYNTILKDTLLSKDLKPGESTEERTLILTQLITTENSSDDLTYRNITEIVNVTNTAGRRMAFSITGNQDPTANKVSEVDSSIAERVIILPPFGETHIFYILGGVIGLILIAGITLIIKKVLKK